MSRASFAAMVVIFLAASAGGCGERRDPSLIVASGHVEATDVRISAKVGGRLERLAPKEGDRVSAGQVVAGIDPVDLRLALDAGVAERGQAQAGLALLLAGERREDIAEAGAQVARAEAELAGAQTELDRMETLLASDAVSRKARDDALTRRDVAKGALEAVSERRRRLKAGFRKEEIAGARARVDAAEARIAQLGQQIRDATVTSPLSGTVTEKIAEPGEIVTAGTALIVVTDLDDAWLTVYVAEPDLGRIRIGQEVDVVTDAGHRRKGKITFVSSKAEFTPKNVQTRDERVKLVYKVKVGLPNGDGLFKPGMPAEARMSAEVVKP